MAEKNKVGDLNIKSTVNETEGNASDFPMMKDSMMTLKDRVEQKKDPDEKSLNSAHFTEDQLKEEEEDKKEKTQKKKEKNPESEQIQRIIEQEKMENQQNLMRQADKLITETERIEQKYQKEHSFLYLYSNDPQLKKLIKSIQKRIIFILLGGLVQLFFSIWNNFILCNNKEAVTMTFFILSSLSFFLDIFIFIIILIGLLNDPYASKAFRILIILEAVIIIVTYVFNFISFIISIEYIKEDYEGLTKWLLIFGNIIVLAGLISIVVIASLLAIDSLMILVGKKIEYSVLVAEEKINKSKDNKGSSETTNDNTNNEKNEEKEKQKKIDEEYIENICNPFHAGVSAERIDDAMKNF